MVAQSSDMMDQWIADTGATHHMTSDLSNLSLKLEYPGSGCRKWHETLNLIYWFFLHPYTSFFFSSQTHFTSSIFKTQSSLSATIC